MGISRASTSSQDQMTHYGKQFRFETRRLSITIRANGNRPLAGSTGQTVGRPRAKSATRFLADLQRTDCRISPLRDPYSALLPGPSFIGSSLPGLRRNARRGGVVQIGLCRGLADESGGNWRCPGNRLSTGSPARSSGCTAHRTFYLSDVCSFVAVGFLKSDGRLDNQIGLGVSAHGTDFLSEMQ